MKILKDPHHGPMFRPLALAGRLRLVCTVMVHFDLDDPESPLPDREMWPQVMKLLPQPPVLDTGLPKPRAEFLAAGKCFAPDGGSKLASQASIRVGESKKTLDVFGDRRWVMTGGVATAVSDPAPFTAMPLVWERAFGGPGDPRNPKGRGLWPDASGPGPFPLPNVEVPDKLMAGPNDTPPPASFLPRDVNHPDRQGKAGTFDEAWKSERWPYYPDNLNPEHFLGAAPDQWLPGFLAGAEAIEIVGMHPKRPVIASQVPSFTMRLFLTRKESPGAPPERDIFEEVRLRRDTLWLFPEVARGVVIFRGVCNAGRDDLADLRYAFMVTEAAGQPPASLEHYLEAQTRRVAAAKPVKPTIPDAGRKVNQELLKMNRVVKDIAEAKAVSMGQVPVMPREPEEIAAMGKAAVASGLAVLDKIQAMAADSRGRFGWRASLEPASFDAPKALLAQSAKSMDESAAVMSQCKSELAAMKADMAKDAGAGLNAAFTPEQLAKAGVDPDNVLAAPEDDLGPWHARGFPFVVQCRRNLEGAAEPPPFLAVLKACKLSSRTISSSWMGLNPAPVTENGPDWGLPPGTFTLPRGMVLPTFEGKKLVRIIVLHERWNPWSFVTVPGSDPAPLWLPAPGEPAPVVVVPGEIEARLMEQEVGDVCHVLVLPTPKTAPPPGAAAAIKDAPAVLVIAREGTQVHLSQASPYLPVSDKAQWLTLPKGTDCLRCMYHGGDLRDLVLDALPPAAVGLPEDEPAPAFGPAPAKKRPVLPDIAALVKASHAEVKAFHEAGFDDLRASMKELEDTARAALAEHGKDLDRVRAEVLAAPRTPLDQTGADMAAQIRTNRDSLKARGVLAPDKEATMTKAAELVEKLGADAEARWQEGEKRLAEAAKKFEAIEAAGPGEPSEEMKAKFRAAGMDLDAMVKRTREEVAAMYAAGKSLSQAILDDVDLSGLDLSRADFTGCRLTRTNFGRAVLDGCVFSGVSAKSADFSGASLEGARFDRAMLQRASFKKASLGGVSLRQAMLDQADLEGADLSFADLHMTCLGKANLTGAVLAGAKLSLVTVQECLAPGAVFRDAQIRRSLVRKTDLTGTDFAGAALDSSQLQECACKGVVLARADFHKGAIADCDLAGCDLSGASARHLHIRGANLSGADIRKARLDSCRVEKSDLTRARMSGTSARGTSFPGTNLEGADLRGADLLFGSLAKARIVAADLRGASCFGVNFHKAVLGKTRLDGANLKMTVLDGRADLLEEPHEGK